MRKTRFQAMTMVVIMLFTMMASGCKKKENGSKKTRGEAQKAEALLDDFCAYLKNGKYDKLTKLVAGNSDEVKKAEGFMKSDVDEIFASARKRISFSIENVSLNKDETEGTAELVFSYFRTKDVIRAVSSTATERDYRLAVEGAKEEEVRIEVELVRDESWLITEDSTDKVFIALFSFLENLNLEVVPTTPPPPTPAPIEVSDCKWFDESLNEVVGYRESTTYIRFALITWNVFNGETFTYEYIDAYGNLAYTGEYTATNNTDIIYCDWTPTTKLATGYINCDVYDKNGNWVGGSCVNIYGDDEPMPREFYAMSYHLIDSEGNAVPGYHAGDEYVALQMDLYEYSDPPFDVYYEIVKDPTDYSYGNTIVYSGYAMVSSETMILPWTDMPELEVGEYEFRVSSVWDYADYYVPFSVKPEGEEFEYDRQTAQAYYGDWFEDPNDWSIMDVSKSTEKVYYIIYLDDLYNYIGFTYKLTDSKGKVLDEGTKEVFYSSSVTMELNMKGAETGNMSLEVYNPDGSLLTSGTIQVVR